MDRSEGPRVGRWGDRTVDRSEDQMVGRSGGPTVDRWGGPTVDRSEDRMVGRSEAPRAETVGASEGPVVALDSFRVRVRIQTMVQAC